MITIKLAAMQNDVIIRKQITLLRSVRLLGQLEFSVKKESQPEKSKSVVSHSVSGCVCMHGTKHSQTCLML